MHAPTLRSVLMSLCTHSLDLKALSLVLVKAQSLSASPFESPRTTTTTSRKISNHHATYQAIRGFRFVENPTVSYPLSDTNPADASLCSSYVYI